jgi:parallel beta-helix repeat protein
MRSIITASMVTLVLVGTFIAASDVRLVRASGGIYIRADGSIDPPTANLTTYDNVTYTFTGHNHDSIVVERDHIVVDGADYTLQGDGAYTSRGIDLTDRTNVTVQNTHINNFSCGLWLNGSSGIRISGNTLTNHQDGVSLDSSFGNIVSGNNVTANDFDGIYLRASHGNLISGNTITNNDDGVELYISSNNTIAGNTMKNRRTGVVLYACPNNRVHDNTLTNDGFLFHGSDQNAVANNTINGKPLVYLEGVSNYTVTGNAGQVVLVRCEYMRVENLTLSNTCVGITLDWTSHSNISRNTVTAHLYGMKFYSSSNNRVFHNNFIDNTDHISIHNSVITADDGYPSGGNYWSGYTDVDVCKGPDQNETGSDGVWDHPYGIVPSPTPTQYDTYPLTRPYGEPVGDVDGDRDVDIFDIVLMAAAYGATYPGAAYDRLRDLDLDGDIDLFDIVLAAGSYGDSW